MEYEDGYQHVPKEKYECLLFDVDDTLYSLNSGLSEECTKNIIEYMITKLGIEEDKVPEMCNQLYKDYGTTMAGLRAIGYDFDYDDYHSFVHGRLPYEILKPDPVLKGLLQSLPIRKVIFTNGNKEHVARVLGRLGLEECFDGVICFETLNPIVKTILADVGETNNDGFEGSKLIRIVGSAESDDDVDNYCETNKGRMPKTPIVCKPFENAFEQAFKMAKINPQRTVFFDDSIRNLRTGKRMGLHTVWVGFSQRTKGVDHALESIHNMREALPELWETTEKTKGGSYSGKVAIETSVEA